MALRKIVMTGKTLPDADRMIRENCEVRCWDQAGIMPQELLLDWLIDAEGLMSVGTKAVRVDEELLANR